MCNGKTIMITGDVRADRGTANREIDVEIGRLPDHMGASAYLNVCWSIAWAFTNGNQHRFPSTAVLADRYQTGD